MAGLNVLATSDDQTCVYTLDPDNVLLKLSKRRLLIGRRGMTVLYIRRILVADDEGRALSVRKHKQAVRGRTEGAEAAGARGG